MTQDRHEGITPQAPATPSQNEFTVTDTGQGQYVPYVPPSASIPDEYWLQAAESKVRANNDTSTVGCWAFVLLGLIIPIMAFGAALWATWMIRDDSRFVFPAAVGFGIVALPFLMG